MRRSNKRKGSKWKNLSVIYFPHPPLFSPTPSPSWRLWFGTRTPPLWRRRCSARRGSRPTSGRRRERQQSSSLGFRIWNEKWVSFIRANNMGRTRAIGKIRRFFFCDGDRMTEGGIWGGGGRVCSPGLCAALETYFWAVLMSIDVPAKCKRLLKWNSFLQTAASDWFYFDRLIASKLPDIARNYCMKTNLSWTFRGKKKYLSSTCGTDSIVQIWHGGVKPESLATCAGLNPTPLQPFQTLPLLFPFGAKEARLHYHNYLFGVCFSDPQIFLLPRSQISFLLRYGDCDWYLWLGR